MMSSMPVSKPKQASKKKTKVVRPAVKVKVPKSPAYDSYSEACKATFGPFQDSDFYSSKAQHILFYTDVTKASAQSLRTELYAAAASKQPIVLHLNSRGGDGFLGIMFANILREIPVPLACAVDGRACSAITPILVAAPYRVMNPYALVMIHEGSFVAQMLWVRDSELKYRTELTLRLSEQYRRVYKKFTKIPDNMLDDMLHRDQYMDDKTCLKHGVVDRVIKFDRAAMRRVFESYVKSDKKASERESCDVLSVRKWSKCNHIYAYNNDGSFVVTQGRRLLNSVAYLAEPLQEYAEGPRAVIVHYNMYMLPRQVMTADVLPLVVRICMSKVPVVGIIDTGIDLIHAIPCIVSHQRYMYENIDLEISLVQDHLRQSVTSYYKDIQINVDLMRDQVLGILKTWTRLPPSVLKSLYTKRMVLSAAQCKEYGIVDHVLTLRRGGARPGPGPRKSPASSPRGSAI